ncbi:MAG: HAD hydrolase-like protein [Chloroflexi bacterium]|nr:HAD hydrolase-like protein [Chloroflexota bacterium]
MKAVFIKRDLLLEPTPTGEQVKLRPGVAECLGSLAAKGLFVIVLDAASCALAPEALPAANAAVTQPMLDAIRAGGGRVDALLECPHRPEDHCGCWGTYPGFLYAAASQLDLRLEECYLLCDEANDVLLAYKVGCRPVLVLNGRAIGDLYDGHQPEPRDFPIARNLSMAVQYVLCEEEANEEWGHPRQPAPLLKLEELPLMDENPAFTPTLKLFSPVPGFKAVLLNLPQLSRSARRWLLFFVLGGVWLSLGIAYLLTHLYRVQPFPAFVWYLTLQFIPRPVRGLLFITTGAAVVWISLRAFLRLFPGNGQRR